MAKKIKELALEKVGSLIEEMGYEVVDCEYVKQSDGMNLIFYIDCDSGVNIDDCEKVSKVIDPVLDEANITDDKPYTLCVSSPGLDRPLKTERDFKRNMGNEIEITLFSKLNGKKVFTGTLEGYNDVSVTIASSGEQLTFEKGKIAHIVPVIKF